MKIRKMLRAWKDAIIVMVHKKCNKLYKVLSIEMRHKLRKYYNYRRSWDSNEN